MPETGWLPGAAVEINRTRTSLVLAVGCEGPGYQTNKRCGADVRTRTELTFHFAGNHGCRGVEASGIRDSNLATNAVLALEFVESKALRRAYCRPTSTDYCRVRYYI